MLPSNTGVLPAKDAMKRKPIVSINRQDLTKVKKIGEGGSSSVFHMIWRSKTGNIDVAAKRLNKVDDHELEVLSSLDHPNIVRLIGVVPDELQYMIILELCEGGSLGSYLKTHKDKPLPSALFDAWSKQAASAIEYLQEMKIIHKDVKSENYLITRNNILKLADFGLAKKTDKTLSKATERGTAAYMAPELFTEGSLSPSFDIFAFGVVLWELITRQIPFQGLEHHPIMYLVCIKKERLPIPDDCPHHLANLMKRCWLEDRYQRPSIKDVLSVLDKADQTKPTRSSEPLGANAQEQAVVEEFRMSLQKALSLGSGANIDAQSNEGPRLKATTPQDNHQSWSHERWLGQQEGPSKLQSVCGLAVCPSGDVAVTDRWPEPCVKVYTDDGRLKFTLDTKTGLKGNRKSLPTSIAVGSRGTFFVTDQTQCVKVFNAGGSETRLFNNVLAKFILRPNQRKVLEGLALDNSGQLLVGVTIKEGVGSYISRHTQDGMYLGSSKVTIQPQCLAVTSRDEIIISSAIEEAVLIIDHRGRPLKKLHAPGVCKWIPRSVCFGMDKIFISGRVDGKASVMCYSVSGDYLEDITKQVGVPEPMGIDLTADCTKLIVADVSRGVVILCRK